MLESRHGHPDRSHRPRAAAAAARGAGLNVTIRVAGTADLSALTSLRRTWTAENAGYGGRADSSSDTGFDDAFDDAFADWWVSERERRTTWLAISGATPIGMINMLEYRRMPRPNRTPSAWGYVGNAYVRPADRGKGVGSRLIAAVVAAARDRRYERLLVNPTERSIPFYQRAGFGPDTGLLALGFAHAGQA